MLVNIPVGIKKRTSAEVTRGLLPELAAGQTISNGLVREQECSGEKCSSFELA